MKNIINKALIFFFITISSHVMAQVNSHGKEQNYKQVVDSLMTNIDKSIFDTDILYDRVFSFSHLDVFNSKRDSIVSNGTHFFQAWSELYHASYNPRQMDVEDLWLIKNSKSNRIEIGVINALFNELDIGIENDPNIKIVDGYFQIMDGRNPVQTNEVTFAGLLREIIFEENVNLKLNPNIIFQNNHNTIKSLKVLIHHSGEQFELINDGQVVDVSIDIDLRNQKKLLLDFEFE